MEWTNLYNKDHRLTSPVRKRGTPWCFVEFGLVLCVGVHDDLGKLLLTQLIVTINRLFARQDSQLNVDM